MSNRNYETQILDAIQMLVDNAVSKADYDKTIKATIVKCVDATIGKYTVKYQDSSFYAYSYNTDVTYTAGTMVYVLIPSNDMSQEKSIIGTVNKLGIDYVTVTEGENGYEVVGINGINSNAIYNLCSYKIKDIQILYDRDANVDLVNLDAFSLETYIRQSSSIICGATFKTNLPLEQQFKGDYGIVFNLDFLDNATGKPVTRSYILNIDQMIGQPYKFNVGTRQYDIFEVDGSNFISVKQIYIFSYNFPKAVEGDSLAREDDIFVSKIELSAANALDPKAIGTAALTFITPRGTIFDDNHIDSDTKSIEAQIRIKSQVIDNESQDVKYYWFKENNKITTKSENYNRYGGTGWECLNLKNIIEPATEDADAIVEWVPGTYSFITSKGNNVAKETTYKCVAVYNAETILSKEIIIYNYSSDYDITIDSDEGTAFYYDLGSPTLTCKINDKEELDSDYEYVWSSVDNNNRFANINETPDDNVAYNEAFEEYSSLLQQIENNVVIESEVQERLAACKQIIDQYEYIMRVDRNKIYQLKISEITNFTTYKCSVFKSDIFIGTASIIISNNIQHDASQYNLVINNGNQIFKYNEQGVAPNSESLEYPIDILPLSFTLYDNEGREVTAEAIGLENIYWTIPNKDTLLITDRSQGEPEEETEQGFVYNKLDQFNFGIAQRFNVNYTKNIIYLSIKYKEHVFSAKTEFTFIKTGEIGTNGTDYICKIVPNARVNSIVPRYPMVTINEYSNAYKLNFETNSMDNWFKIQLWKNGEQIFEGTENGKSIENIDVKVTWSVLKNNYGNEVIDDSNFTINSSTGEIYFNTTQYTNPANIIKCTIEYDDAEYFATMPVMISRVKNDDYEILLSEDSGFRYAMYTADGRNPSYKERSPFTVMVSQIINGAKNNISLSEVENYKVDYE